MGDFSSGGLSAEFAVCVFNAHVEKRAKKPGTARGLSPQYKGRDGAKRPLLCFLPLMKAYPSGGQWELSLYGPGTKPIGPFPLVGVGEMEGGESGVEWSNWPCSHTRARAVRKLLGV